MCNGAHELEQVAESLVHWHLPLTHLWPMPQLKHPVPQKAGSLVMSTHLGRPSSPTQQPPWFRNCPLPHVLPQAPQLNTSMSCGAIARGAKLTITQPGVPVPL
jgi:hypothetical protein